MATISFDDLTFDELDLIEETLGIPFEDFLDEKRTTQLRAMAFIAQRRDDPTFAWKDVGSLRFAVVSGEPADAVKKGRPTDASG